MTSLGLFTLLARTSRLYSPSCSISSSTRSYGSMANQQSQSSSLRILMLHGYTQNGPLFHAKTRVLEKHLQKTFPGVSMVYPTAPIPLKASDIPGFDPERYGGHEEEIEAFGWWRRRDDSDPVEYEGIEKTLDLLAAILSTQGPFDGVMGFSQGAALAAMVASLLEGESRRAAFKVQQEKSQHGIPYPQSFAALQHAPLKFGIYYCGFRAPGNRYVGFYEPHISTPSCSVIGSLDSVVEDKRTQALVDACGGSNKTQVLIHPGGHFVPSGKQYLDAVVSFIKSKLSVQSHSTKEEEERVEDMEVPF